MPEKHNTTVFENFKRLKDANPLPFLQLCIYYYADIIPAIVREVTFEDSQIYTEAITKKQEWSDNNLNKKTPTFKWWWK